MEVVEDQETRASYLEEVVAQAAVGSKDVLEAEADVRHWGNC